MSRTVLVAAVLLGVISRIDDRSGGTWSVSADGTWVALGLAAGVASCGPRVWAAASSVVALTVANASYYTWIAVTEPGVALDAAAGPPLRWFALGIGGGIVTGLIGRQCAHGPRSARAAALVAALLCVSVGPTVEPRVL